MKSAFNQKLSFSADPKLKAMGIVIRVGKKKSGHWKIIDK
jgi:hypothetical protein